MIKVCFISLKSYPLFINRSTKYFGGAEVQISLITRELAKDKQFQVSLVVKDYGQKRVIKRKKVIIFKTKINLFDFFKVLKTTDADVYVERTANVKVFLVACFCKIFNKKFIYMLAHDWDVSNKWLYWFGLRFADLIITQSQDQKQSLKKVFNLSSRVIPSLIKIKVVKKQEKKEFVLWVGRADNWKQPFEYLNLIEKNPQEKFVMICRQGKNIKLFNQVRLRAIKQDNLKFFPAVPFEKTANYFNKAKVLINTSTAEGAPNTFLQAGLGKTPVLSLKVNPDKYLDKYNCGLVAENLQNKMQNLFRKMLKNPKMLKVMGLNHYNYVKKNHSLKNIDIFKQTVLNCINE